MRIAIGQLWQESNTFNPLPTTWADFEAFGHFEGDAIIKQFADTNELGGFIQTLRAFPTPVEIIGLQRFAAWPSGPIDAPTFRLLIDRMLGSLSQAGRVDGVLLALHGALVADGEPDVSGHLLARVRELVGPSVPIVATLDLHANMTARLVAAADVLTLYHTAPHIDVMNTGKRAAQSLRRMLFEGAKPVTAFRKLPMVVPAERANTQDPNSISFSIRKTLEGWERNPFVLSAGIATVQPWLDIPEMGTSVLVTCAGPEWRNWAEQSCSELARAVWQRRREYLPEIVDPTWAVAQAHACSDGLTVISDSADATTSGSTGDSTVLLREMLKYTWPRPAIVPIVDPAVVAEADRLGVGATFAATMGGTRNRRDFQPITLDVTVKTTFDAKFILSGHLGDKLPIDIGRSAVLTHGNVHIVATSRSGPHFAPQLFQTAGLDPFTASLLIAKSPCGFRAAYADQSKQIFVARAPGCAPSDFWNYPFIRIPRPLWPWDEMGDL